MIPWQYSIRVEAIRAKTTAFAMVPAAAIVAHVHRTMMELTANVSRPSGYSF